MLLEEPVIWKMQVYVRQIRENTIICLLDDFYNAQVINY